jgi:dienelactone hydrolase
MKKITVALLVLAASSTLLKGEIKSSGTFREQPEKYWSFAELSKTPAYRNSPFEDSKVNGLRDILVTGTEFKGKKAEFFAYIGYPAGSVPQGGFPGIVLIHGGGGTAFPQYVKLWTSHGFAVIALDWYNCRPQTTQSTNEGEVKKIPLEGGNRQNHVANTANMVLAHSLLRSLENVNPDKTAFVGLSWGSWYGAMVAAVDPRFKGIIEIYCGDATPDIKDRFIDGRFLHAAKVPMYWVAGTNDQNVTPKSLQKGFDECAKLENKSLVINLPHSHIGFTFDACFRMADFFLKDGISLPKLGNAVVNNRSISADIVLTGKGITKAILCYTCDRDEKVSHKRIWKSIPAQFDTKKVWAELPEGVYQCFLSAYDQKSQWNELCGSTDLKEFDK